MPSEVPVVLPVLSGPTASGKSALALAYAEKKGAKILSADSMQIYRGLDIGTAKPSREERSRVPHLMIDILNPSEDYSVARFQKDARTCLISETEANHSLVICGGSGQYVCALTENEVYQDEKPSEEMLAAFRDRYETKENAELFRELNDVDPLRAGQIHPNDRKRLLRALQKYLISGQKPSDLNPKKGKASNDLPFSYLTFVISRPRDELHRRIEARIEEMFRLGLLEEAEFCYLEAREGRLSRSCRQAIAYKELFPYFEGKSSLSEVKERLLFATRQYAKRQETWWRKKKGVLFLEATDLTSMLRTVEKELRFAEHRLETR